MTAGNDPGPAAPPLPAAGGDGYASLEALHDAHDALLRAYRGDPDGPDLGGRVEDFRARAAATGARLRDPAERQAAQNLLDYWAAALYRRCGEPPAVVRLARFRPGAEAPLAGVPCPFPDLSPIGEDQARQLLGRDALVQKCLEALQANHLLVL